MTVLEERPAEPGEEPTRPVGIAGTLTTTDGKRIGLLVIGTALALFFGLGALALVMRAQLAQPREGLLDPHVYAQVFTMHGSGMIYLVITPFALGFGVYLVPLHVGAPNIAAPRATLLGFWMYAAGAVCMLAGFGVGGGAGDTGWYSYPPLSDVQYSPGRGMDLWIVGVLLAVGGMMILAATVLWTALRCRAPGMTLLRMSVFTWSMVASCLMVIAAFPSLLVAMSLLAAGRVDPSMFDQNMWDIGYQNLFWFYGHPVVYVMFFPFVGAVWGHHLFATGQAANDYYSVTSIALTVPAGIEYFGFLATIVSGRLVYPAAMYFALGFIPMFLVGGLTGVMLGTPVVDYHLNGSYFVVAHFHYTLVGGSLFGFFAGFYLWFPKATGFLLGERLGKVHFWLLLIGTNATFGPMLVLGFDGLPRRVATYPKGAGFATLDLVASIGAGVLGLAMVVFLINILVSLRKRRPAGDDPWGGQTLEWATSSPPPRFNFTRVPPVLSYAPLQDLRKKEEEQVP
jgi:cytochrome c oxidase subunit 1